MPYVGDLAIACFIVENYGPDGYYAFTRDFLSYYDEVSVEEREQSLGQVSYEFSMMRILRIMFIIVLTFVWINEVYQLINLINHYFTTTLLLLYYYFTTTLLLLYY